MKPWKIPLHRSSIGKEEIAAVVKTMKSGQLTMGKQVRKFEEAWEKKLGKHCIMVNSGSSANLLMWAVLTSPLREERLLPGSEVIVPALCWPTTVWPIVQHGLVPVFVDIDHTLNLNGDMLRSAEHFKTSAIVCLPLYGRPLKPFVHRSWVVEDACETAGDIQGDMGSLSFYFSHHMTTGEGGMLVCADKNDAQIARMIRAHGWLRDCLPGTAPVNEVGPDWADGRFLFVCAGYNLRPTELAAAIGLEQLKKLPKMNARRIRAAQIIGNRDYDFPPFGVTFMAKSQAHRQQIVTTLAGKGIETRPILCGNMAEQPGMKHYPHRVHSDAVARQVARCGFSVGCVGIGDADARWMSKVIREAMA